MSLEPGGNLLHYRFVEKIGEGGMGVVWKAMDTTLDREVAIKILPGELSAESERLVRFEREARFLASLNHPHIATIHGLHRVEGTHFLAMEYVPGEDLSVRLARGPLTLDATLEVARQVCDALEAAHEQGVVHRDLKPANIKLTPDGRIKVLDFGLAKALIPEPSSGASSPAMSPTLTSGGTAAGMILGTAAYMSPEQARGRPVDKRTDIFAFGCILYEMLTGERAFRGETVSDTLASVLKEPPDVSMLPTSAGPAFRRVLLRCLDKDPRRRYRDVGDARFDLEQAVEGDAEPPTATTRPAAARAWLLGTTAVLAALVLVLAGIVLRGGGAAPTLLRAEIGAPEGYRLNLTGDYAGPPAAAPDGSRTAFVAVGNDGQSRLFVRSLDALQAQVVAGSAGAYLPFWSPDGESLGFFSGTTLKRVDLDGSPPITLIDSPEVIGQGKGGSWSRDGVIAFAPYSTSGLYAIPAGGGEPVPVTQLDPAVHTTHRWPHFLEDGRRFIYLAAHHADPGGPATAIYLGSLDGGPVRRVMRTRAEAAYAAGRILYLQGDTLMAQRFDAASARLVGSAERLLEEVQVDLTTWKAGFGATDELLVYVPRGSGRGMELQWFDRQGRLLGGVGTPANYQNLELSPDGSRVAAESQHDGPNGEIWMHDLQRQAEVRLTFNPEDDAIPLWSPDGELIYFAAEREGRYRIHSKRFSGAGEEQPFFESERDVMPMSWSPDGRFLLVVELGDAAQTAATELQVVRDGEAFALGLDPGARINKAVFSPDGRFIAYASTVTGRSEIYVVAFLERDGKPATGGRWQITTEGGFGPRWRGDGRELFYVRPDNTVMAVPVTATRDAIETGVAIPLFRTLQRSDAVAYDVTSDGQRFLVSTLGADAAKPLAVTLHWTAQLD